MFAFSDYAITFGALLVLCAIGYLCGSISFAVIFTKKYANFDVREKGSGNAGMTNVMRTAGKKPGILTFLCDLAKGFIPTFFAEYVMKWVGEFVTNGNTQFSGIIHPTVCMCIVGVFCLLGHMYPCFFGFKGGKGIATVAGVILAISPIAMIVSISLFAVLTLITKIVSSSSIAACISSVILVCVTFSEPADYNFYLFNGYQRLVATLITSLMAVIIIYRHKDNIIRLFKGTESKFTLKK